MSDPYPSAPQSPGSVYTQPRQPYTHTWPPQETYVPGYQQHPETIPASGLAGVGPAWSGRPDSALGASVLGIISGVLGLFHGIQSALGAFFLHEVIISFELSDTLMPYVIFAYANVLAVLVTSVALLVSGITFLQGKGYTVLLLGAISQAVLTLLAVSPLVLLNLTPDSDMGQAFSAGFPPSAVLVIFTLLIGLGLAGFTIGMLATRSARSWRK